MIDTLRQLPKEINCLFKQMVCFFVLFLWIYIYHRFQKYGALSDVNKSYIWSLYLTEGYT